MTAGPAAAAGTTTRPGLLVLTLALGSTLAVTLIAATLDPATGFPRGIAYTWIGLVGALASAAVVAVAVVGLLADRRGGADRRPDPLADVEQATAGAGEWSPVSGIR